MRSKTIPANGPRMSTCHMSACVIPSRSPKSTWERLMFEGFFDTSTRPMAKSVVKTMPMLASDLRWDVCLTAKMRPTTRSAAASAPTEYGIPSMWATTTPGRTACESASPIRDQPTRTIQQLMIAHTAPAIAVTTIPRTMNS